MPPLIEVKKLAVIYQNQNKSQPILKDINFQISPKETLCLLGETGSGKSVTALSILRLLSPFFLISKHSEILLENQDLLTLSEVKMRQVRSRKLGIIFQEPSTSFNPIITIGKQIEEALLLQPTTSHKTLKAQVLNLLEIVQFQDPQRIYKAYPHQLSGGMKQRAMIAMALAGDPALLIADEATTALDPIMEDQILNLLKQIQSEFGMGILLITHDLSIAAKMADNIAVMNKGEIVEQDNKLTILQNPTHPYTKNLMNAHPSLSKPDVPSKSEIVLSVSQLHIHFNDNNQTIRAVEDVSLSLKEGETLAVIGGSGSGKTTLAKGIMSLIAPKQGQIHWLEEDISQLSPYQLRPKRSDFQMIFQESMSAMDPRFTVKEVIEEGMLALGIGSSPAEREERILHLLNEVDLLPEHCYRYPHQLSGGQRQRVCIARALAVGPRVLVCDEPTSSLDRHIQAQVIDLLLSLQKEYEMAYLLITHDLEVVRAMAHRVAVMQSGKMVEHGLVDEVLKTPQHDYTKAILSSFS